MKMKKLLFGIIALLSFNAATIAQAVKQAPVTAPASKMKAATPQAKVVPMEKTTTVAPKPVATTGAVVLKKDGTPDKRYNNAATTVPLKKDGTPDKRYKGNKKN